MGHLDIWRTEPGGGLATEANGLRLSVHAPESLNGAVRFLVSRPDGGAASRGLLASGTEENARAAMRAAVRSAERILGHPFSAG